MKNAALGLIKDLLIARRNGNVVREQAAYDKLYAFAQKHNFDFAALLEDGTRYLKTHSVSMIAGGYI